VSVEVQEALSVTLAVVINSILTLFQKHSILTSKVYKNFTPIPILTVEID